MLNFELALFGYALKGFTGIFDPVLIVVAVGRQELDNFVSSAGAGPADGA
jgi:hypothetical protein